LSIVDVPQDFSGTLQNGTAQKEANFINGSGLLCMFISFVPSNS
jgi:hypothetical protein